MLQEIIGRLQTHPWIAGDPGMQGWLLFAVASSCSQVILLPITAFAIAAGFLFGFWKGVCVMLLGKMGGAILNFGLARNLAQTPAQWLTRRFPIFHTLSDSLEKEGLKLAVLMRLCPLPFALSSYGYGLTRVAFRHYVLATFLGIIGPSLVFVGVGVSARDGMDSLTGAAPPKSRWEMGLFLVGITASVFVTRRIAKVARQKLALSTTVQKVD